MVSPFGRGFDSLQLHKIRSLFGDLILWSWRESRETVDIFVEIVLPTVRYIVVLYFNNDYWTIFVVQNNYSQRQASMWRRFCGFILKVWGWKVDPHLPEEDKIILLGAPHTSILDFVVAYMFYQTIGGSCLCMVKKELFFPPLGWLIRLMGGIPVDRKKPAAVVRSVLNEMNKREKFHLAIAPEGTRKPVRRWKQGYHLIATEAGIPVYLAYFDWKRKAIGCGKKVELTDDAAADTRRIQSIYESMDLGARHPDKYLTH